jgi:predicted nucleotidyltransferase
MDRDELNRELKRRLEEAFGDRLKGAVVYGSEARGQVSEDSDIDVMVLPEGPHDRSDGEVDHRSTLIRADHGDGTTTPRTAASADFAD